MRELAIVNSQDRASAFDANISTFDPETRVHSLSTAAPQYPHEADVRTDVELVDGGVPLAGPQLATCALVGQNPGYRTTATWSGQTLARLGDDSKIIELWLNEKPVSFDRQFVSELQNPI